MNEIMNMVTIPTVGADAYPKGTGSTSRSCLAGCRWPPAARAKKERSIAPPFWVYSIVRAGRGQSTVRMKLTPLFCIFTLRCTRSPRM